ncbi:YfdX family protein [Thioclava sp. BHET1]|nr:YfdX family protein [Thioclava sp. BHET1]
MKRKSNLLALVLTTALAAGPVAALADQGSTGASTKTMQTNKDAVAQTTTSSNTSKSLVTTVDDAYSAMRDVRAARLALFDGQPKIADKMTNKALEKMTSAEKSEAKWGVKSKTGDPTLTYLPFDSSIALGEDFKVTPDNQKAVTKANKQIASGDSKGAADTLKAQDINVSISAALVAGKPAIADLKMAASEIGKGKFYEANLELKKIEDSVVIDQWGLNDLPAQAGKAQSSAAAKTTTGAAQSTTAQAKATAG